MKKHFLGFFICLLALIIGGISYSYGAYYSGKIEAHFDLMKGKYVIRAYGMPSAGRGKYREILLRDYGVELIAVASCVATPELVAETDGYNEVTEAAIEKRFGQGVLEKAWQQAQHEYQREHSIKQLE